MSVAELVNNKLARMKRGAPFSIERFYTLATSSALATMFIVGEIIKGLGRE